MSCVIANFIAKFECGETRWLARLPAARQVRSYPGLQVHASTLTYTAMLISGKESHQYEILIRTLKKQEIIQLLKTFSSLVPLATVFDLYFILGYHFRAHE